MPNLEAKTGSEMTRENASGEIFLLRGAAEKKLLPEIGICWKKKLNARF